MVLTSEQFFLTIVYRLLPTKNNREKWNLEKELNSKILEVVKQRTEAGHEKDLLQMILEGAKTNNVDHDHDHDHEKITVDNCKNIYYAGHETIAMTASWSLMLLVAHPDWQARVRAEVLENFKGGILDPDMLRNMKVVRDLLYPFNLLFVFFVVAGLVLAKKLDSIDFDGCLPKYMYMATCNGDSRDLASLPTSSVCDEGSFARY